MAVDKIFSGLNIGRRKSLHRVEETPTGLVTGEASLKDQVISYLKSNDGMDESEIDRCNHHSNELIW